MNSKKKPVYIVAAKRSAVGKALKGGFAKQRPDELLAQVLKQTIMESGINPVDIGDVIIGCAFPEAEQGQNIARIAALLAGLPDSVPGMTLNRYCSSGLNSIAIAADAISLGHAQVMVAGGVESMSMIPMGGNDWGVSPQVFLKDSNVAIAYGMGLTAEVVANEWQISRQAQDEFALNSHKKAVAAMNNGYLTEEIIPIEVLHRLPHEISGTIIEHKVIVKQDEGARADTSLEALARLKPAFAAKGSVTAGNSSQMSDGAACLVLVSEDYLLKHNLTALGKFLGFAVAGVDPKTMGIGPVKAIPKVLEQTGLKLEQIEWIELNEAFAAQSLAVIKELNLNPDIINPYGGAIALGHPLGATGSILSTKLLHALKRSGKKYGMVTMCIGTGMGAAGVFEMV